MAEGGEEPNCSINWHYKDDYIRVSVEIPGLKTQFAGIGKRKVDPKSADVFCSFADNRVSLKVEMLAGTKRGMKYNKELDKDDLNCLVSPEPQSYYKAEDDRINLFIRKR